MTTSYHIERIKYFIKYHPERCGFTLGELWKLSLALDGSDPQERERAIETLTSRAIPYIEKRESEREEARRKYIESPEYKKQQAASQKRAERRDWLKTIKAQEKLIREVPF